MILGMYENVGLDERIESTTYVKYDDLKWGLVISIKGGINEKSGELPVQDVVPGKVRLEERKVSLKRIMI